MAAQEQKQLQLGFALSCSPAMFFAAVFPARQSAATEFLRMKTDASGIFSPRWTKKDLFRPHATTHSHRFLDLRRKQTRRSGPWLLHGASQAGLLV